MATPRLAIVNCADTGPLESLVDMLDSIGCEVRIPGKAHREHLKSIGCDLVLSPEGLAESMGYEHPCYGGNDIRETGKFWEKEMRSADLFVDLKAHRCYHKVVAAHPHLTNRVLWYRINGGKPEHVKNERGDFGDEVRPPCPVLTPNQWYSFCNLCSGEGCSPASQRQDPKFRCDDGKPPFAYCIYPPFVKFEEYNEPRVFERGSGRRGGYDTPICLIHNAPGWGYQSLIEPVRQLGVKVFGAGSPDGLIKHFLVKVRLTTALAMVHLKSNDAPGYALYEAMAAACPIILPRRLIWRCRMGDLFKPGVNCLVFDRETHDALSDEEVRICAREIGDHLRQLGDKAENKRIGEAGRESLRKIMWSRDRPEDVSSLQAFFLRNFP